MTPEPSDRCTRALVAPPKGLPKNWRKIGSEKKGEVCCWIVREA